ncbi:site-specific tyrosine recombinase/integron integrase [Cutibacterium sp.]|uniref:site-specific tyrosine recombinase/integron integrase n=1 Tax=Cutibacterium sp. TaxID=1912221 RepID=UPI0026DBAC37|nr:site-specific tyrosine recombinase/integron integrase [Cutibacterium sp.]MDO4411847.1 tyrosine-type recombinase/integrase [Cutibacterium sp.]
MAKLNDYLAETLVSLQRKVSETESTREYRADEVFSIHIGKTPPRKQQEWFSFDHADNVIWMSIKDMGNAGVYLIDSSEYLTNQAVEKFNIRKCNPGSILLSFKLTIGRVGIAANEMVTNEAIACFASDDDRRLAYLYPLLLTYDYASMGSTSSIATAVNSKMIKAMPIQVPGEDVLDVYYEQTKPIFDLLLSNTREIFTLEQMRDSLLPKLMSGEIDVSEIHLPMQPNNHLSRAVSCYSKITSSFLLKGFAMETTINFVLGQMQSVLSCVQLKRLREVLRFALSPRQEPSIDLLHLFLTAKEVEGCSPRTISYYESTIRHMVNTIDKPYTQVESDDLRKYLSDYEATRRAGKVTIDNIRRILSSFFSWLEDEDYIVKSPVRRIHKVKTATVAKEVLSDEDLETLRDSCTNARDLAIVDMLATTGMRVGELVDLDIADIDLQERECVVTGKGNKQRPVYFDARAKLHLQAYLKSRDDDSSALFVSLGASASRLSIGGVESRLRELGKACGVGRVYPHKFRRTLATHAIDKGMPIEQVQKLLGHARIDTTMHYAMVNQNNVKASHRKYLE